MSSSSVSILWDSVYAPKKELSKYALCLYRKNKIIIHRKIIILEISMGKIKSNTKLVDQKRNIQKKIM